jgi:hypothetical protein
MASRGPVDYVVIAFPGNRFKGEIVPAVAELVDNDVVRIIGGCSTTRISSWPPRPSSPTARRR